MVCEADDRADVRGMKWNGLFRKTKEPGMSKLWKQSVFKAQL